MGSDPGGPRIDAGLLEAGRPHEEASRHRAHRPETGCARGLRMEDWIALQTFDPQWMMSRTCSCSSAGRLTLTAERPALPSYSETAAADLNALIWEVQRVALALVC